jgi:hypothetical protein
MIDATNAELNLTLEPAGPASTKIRATIGFYCDTWIEGRLATVDQVPPAAKSALKGCIQDVLYGDLIKILLSLHKSALDLAPYGTPLHSHIKGQFEDAFELMRLHNVPFTQQPIDPNK